MPQDHQRDPVWQDSRALEERAGEVQGVPLFCSADQRAAENGASVSILPPDVKLAEADRLRKLFDDAGQGEHNVLALIDHYQRNSMESDARLRAVRELLEENGCDCPRDHHPDECGPSCEVCLACRIGQAIETGRA